MTERTTIAGAGTAPEATGNPPPTNPWPALWALVIGFFMILVDTTIVAVANPAIKAALDPATNSLDNVVWVTSAYLLAYAVPLLITGRLGDRFGPKNIYLIGLTIFTLASLGCGLSSSLGMLIAARAVQGIGAALMTPQTMAVITRTFPPHRRGAAMGLWGATAGVATLAGPLAGGLLVDGFGWEWIFFINIPVGVDRLRAGLAAGAVAADPSAPVRPARCRAQCGRPVPDRVRPAGGREVRLGHHLGADLGLVDDHRRRARAGVVRLDPGAHQERAAGAAGAVPGPQLLGDAA